MLDLIIKALAAYLIGSIMGGVLIGKLRGGVDIRTEGSGNLGATNAWRTQGPLFALLVFVIDVGKGIFATLLLPHLPLPLLTEGAQLRQWTPYVCGVTVMLGHVYPLYFGFRGGKGVATLIGVWACLLPQALPYALVTWAVVLVMSGYVSLASLGAGLALSLAALLLGMPAAAVIFAFATTALLCYTHRVNLQRLREGTEHRFRKVMLFKR